MSRIDDLASQTVPVGTLRVSLMSKATLIAGVTAAGAPVAMQLGAGGTIPITPSSTVRTPALGSANSSGSIAAGAQSVTIATSSDFVGTILGQTVKANTVYTWTCQGNDTLAAIAYTMSAGSISYSKLT